MTDHNGNDVAIGVTHLLLGGQLILLLKCPFCNFRNIHEDEITHHIRYKGDIKHDVDVYKLDKSMYIVTKSHSHYTYESKEDLPLPWIQCLWCKYRDKVERDLEWHFLENHKKKLYREVKVSPYERMRASKYEPFGFMDSPIEYRLQKAVGLAKKNTQSLSSQEEAEN